MKLIFRGWSGGGKTHEQELTPIQLKSGRYSIEKKGPAVWHSSKNLFSKAEDLSLKGSYLVEIEMELEELSNWLSVFAKEQPEKALTLIAHAQTEALIALTKLNAE